MQLPLTSLRNCSGFDHFCSRVQGTIATLKRFNKYVLYSVCERRSVFRCCSGNGVIFIINQPEATNGITPSFEAYFTVRALTTKSKAVNTPCDSINHLDNRWLQTKLDRPVETTEQSVSPDICPMLLKRWENVLTEMLPLTSFHCSCHY